MTCGAGWALATGTGVSRPGALEHRDRGPGQRREEQRTGEADGRERPRASPDSAELPLGVAPAVLLGGHPLRPEVPQRRDR